MRRFREDVLMSLILATMAPLAGSGRSSSGLVGRRRAPGPALASISVSVEDMHRSPLCPHPNMRGWHRSWIRLAGFLADESSTSVLEVSREVLWPPRMEGRRQRRGWAEGVGKLEPETRKRGLYVYLLRVATGASMSVTLHGGDVLLSL